jgi:hypothetical protein
MLCQLFSTSRLLLPTPPVCLQPLSYLFGLREPLSFLFLPSPPLLFPLAPAFFLPHAPLLVLPAAFFFSLPRLLFSLPRRLFSLSRVLLSIPPLSLQPLSYLFGLRTSLPFLFPPTPAFFLPHAPLLVLAATVFFLLANYLRLLTTAGFSVLPNRLRLLTTDLFLLHPSYRLSLLPCSLPLSSPLFCQPLPRGFPYDPALDILWSCRPAGVLAPALFWRLERHETIFHMIPKHLVSLHSHPWSRYGPFATRVCCVYPSSLGLCLWRSGWKTAGLRCRHAEATTTARQTCYILIQRRFRCSSVLTDL